MNRSDNVMIHAGVILALCLLASPVTAGKELRSEEIYKRAKASSVEVLVGGRQDGSGWFADPEGLVVTAAHAVKGRKEKFEVVSPVAGRLPAELIAIDRGHDIALLRVPKSDKPYPFLKIAKQAPPPGHEVYLFGGAFFRHQVMIRGTMARDSSTFEYLSDQQCYTEIYHVSAPSPPGTSGGCWLDMQCRVIGNQSAFLSQNGIGMGIAMAASPDAIERMVRTRTSAVTPTVGTGFEEVFSQPPKFLKRFPEGTTGLAPVLPVKGGPAQKAGLVGDMIITAVNGKPVVYRDAFLRVIRSAKPGDVVTLTVLLPDDGGSKEIKVTLGQL